MEPTEATAHATEGSDGSSSSVPSEVKTSIEPATSTTAALTPPTSEEMNHGVKNEPDESDLSELDLDDDDEEEIFPDHYWDGDNGGRIPVFKPTMDQFRSFKKFMEKIDKYGMKSGIVKVIPPKEWRDSLPALDEYIRQIRIKNPITQEFNGTFGTYTQQNVEKQRSYNLPEWKGLTNETQHQPPAKRGERRRNQEKVTRGGGSLRGRVSTTAAASDDRNSPRPKRRPGRPRRNPLPTEEPASDDDESKDKPADPSLDPLTPPSPAEKPAPKPAKKQRGRPPKTGGQAKSITSRRLNNTAEAVDYVDEEAFKAFDYRLEGVEEYTPERCAELETHYWKSLGFNQPMYAADMPGSLFDDTVTSWNVAKLENLLDVLGTKVPGVNTAYLYMGMWKATFAWHLEDVDLYSINYIHFGAPKQWYSISQEDARKFERAMKNLWPMDSKNCDQFLRHKTYLVSPDVLQKQFNVKVNKLVHFEGEFVITYPYGYHSGYNLGYNCAESVNFALESWLEYGRIARKCNCESDNVWVDVAEIERKLRGEPTPEYYEETDEDDDDMDEAEDGNLPSPPASVKGQKSKSRKRKRDVKQEAPKKKKKIRIRIRAPSREPCVLCPNENSWEPLLPTDSGKKAHRSCALYTPETFIINENAKEKICGVTDIDKARLDLKWNFCRSKRGACFQCSSKKCTRAFHASCAIAAGVLVDAGPVPTFAEDGTEYFEEGYDFRCRYHRPKMPKNTTVDSLENGKRTQNYAKDLKPNDTVQAQYIGGEIFGALVIENRPSELTVVADVLPDGERIELDWKWLCVLDPDDSLRPKPSAGALPMPADRSKSKFSISNRQDGVPTQDEPFHDNPMFKWQDFYNMHMPPPGYATVPLRAAMRLKVDVDAPDQLYYYLGKPSSETKCFFADQPGSKDIAPKASFMERVAPRPTFQYSSNKQPLAPAFGGNTAYVRNPSAPGPSRIEKPYVYKPKEPARPHVMCSVDYQSLANQRNFLVEGNQSSSPFPILQPLNTNMTYQSPYAYQGAEASNDAGPLRAFPSDQYYSSKTLPAAYQGEYSAFRRQSQGAQSMQRPDMETMGNASNGQPSTTAGKGEQLDGVTTHSESRPSSSAHSHHSQMAAPLTPATTASSHSKLADPQTDLGYIQNLQKYPHLMHSFCRRPKAYESPYPTGGGFSARYLSSELQMQSESTSASRVTSAHTPSNSISSLHDPARRPSQQWSPPSQVWDRAGLADRQRTPPLPPPPPPPPQQQQHHHHAYPPLLPRQYSPTRHQTSPEFQRTVQALPSTASRDGAHARMLRDQGYLPYSTAGGYQLPNSGQLSDTAKTWNSPQAPTPSPLSGANTPGQNGQQPSIQHGTWTTVQREEPFHDRLSGPSFGPTLPQMGDGHETWRYT